MAEHKSEKNLSSLLPKVHHLYPVGRLDRDSEGLLILTTDGDFAQKIMHPKNKCEKEYFVIVIGNVLDGDLVKMQKGMLVPLEEKGDIKKKMARVKSASIIKRETGRSYISIVLEEGQKRQIRRMFQHLGFPVQYLKRVRIGQISLDKLPLGKSRDLTPREINSLIA